ncbi:hypothetical protein ACLOJK_002163 [Asimina triloba]
MVILQSGWALKGSIICDKVVAKPWSCVLIVVSNPGGPFNSLTRGYWREYRCDVSEKAEEVEFKEFQELSVSDEAAEDVGAYFSRFSR